MAAGKIYLSAILKELLDGIDSNLDELKTSMEAVKDAATPIPGKIDEQIIAFGNKFNEQIAAFGDIANDIITAISQNVSFAHIKNGNTHTQQLFSEDIALDNSSPVAGYYDFAMVCNCTGTAHFKMNFNKPAASVGGVNGRIVINNSSSFDNFIDFSITSIAAATKNVTKEIDIPVNDGDIIYWYIRRSNTVAVTLKNTSELTYDIVNPVTSPLSISKRE